MRRLLSSSLVIAVIALAGCGEEERGQTPSSAGGAGTGATESGGGEPSETGGGGAPAQGVLQVDVTEDGFDPSDVSARVGQAVNFTNRTDAPVRLTGAEGEAAIDEELRPEQTFTFRPDAAGTVPVRLANGGATATITIVDE